MENAKKNYPKVLSEVKQEHPDWTPDNWKTETLSRLAKQNEVKEPQEEKKETKPEVKEKKTDDGMMLSKADILNLLSKAGGDSDTKELLKKLIEETKASNVPESLRHRITAIREDEIDMDDFMEEPATFFSYHAYYSVFGDKKYGREVGTPYDTPIRFVLRSTKRMHDDSKFAQSTLCICVATIQSKKECEFLRKHTLYGADFYEEIQGVANIDVTIASKYGEVSSMISGWSQHQVLNRAKIENIEIGTDIEEVKKKLVHKLAFAELERIKKQRENNAKDLHSSSPVEVNPENYLNKSTTKIFN